MTNGNSIMTPPLLAGGTMEMEKLTKNGYGVVPLTSLMQKYTFANILTWQIKDTVTQKPIGKLSSLVPLRRIEIAKFQSFRTRLNFIPQGKNQIL